MVCYQETPSAVGGSDFWAYRMGSCSEMMPVVFLFPELEGGPQDLQLI